MTTIQLIRHARPSSAWGGGDSDPGLGLVGEAQARVAARTLLADPEPPKRVISSPLRRSRETAASTGAALRLAVETDPRVGEVPTPEALAPGERSRWLGRAMAGCWREISGGMDYDAWRRSVASAVAGYPGAVIFTHFLALNAVASTILEVDDVVVFRPDFASITTLTWTQGRLAIRSLGAESATEVA